MNPRHAPGGGERRRPGRATAGRRELRLAARRPARLARGSTRRVVPEFPGGWTATTRIHSRRPGGRNGWFWNLPLVPDPTPRL